MRVRLRRWISRLVDILSSLELPPEKAPALERQNLSELEPTQLKQAVHYLSVSARYFRLCVLFFGLRYRLPHVH